MSAKRKITDRKTATRASTTSNAPTPTTTAPSETKTAIHPYEVAGFTRGLKWDSISVGSTAPTGRSPKPLEHKPEPTTPEPSPMARFAARSLEEKARVFLLFSKLLTEELGKLQGAPEEISSPAPKPDEESDKLPTPTRVKWVHGVRIVTRSSAGGITVVSNAPLVPPQKKFKPGCE